MRHASCMSAVERVAPWRTSTTTILPSASRSDTAVARSTQNTKARTASSRSRSVGSCEEGGEGGRVSEAVVNGSSARGGSDQQQQQQQRRRRQSRTCSRVR
jgi:hypothetical protein